MIVDINYIKNVLQVDIGDSQLQYLLHHYFENICEEINIISTLDEQDLSDVPLVSEEMQMLGYNDTSLFQDTIIYGIACHLNNMNVPRDIHTKGSKSEKDKYMILLVSGI